MPRLSIWLVIVDGTNIRPRTGLTDVFLQPQSDVDSANPDIMPADVDSVILVEAPTKGIYYADIDNPAARYDLYVNGFKDTDFGGTRGFNIPATRSIFFKRGLEVDSTQFGIPPSVPSSPQIAEHYVTGIGKVETPDGGQTWPKFSVGNPPLVFIFPPSELQGNTYVHRIIKLVKDSALVDETGALNFDLSLDPNGPELAHYYCDLMVVVP